MIFNEIYSTYYNVAAKIINEILHGNTDEKSLNEIISNNAFGESMLTIMPAMKNEKWQIVKSDLTTPIKHKPVMPVTAVQKAWLKAISLDSRIRLFNQLILGLENIEPLFTADDYVVYDKYSDGDPYNDEEYINRFHTILKAIHGKNKIKIEMTSRRGKNISVICMPEKLEYSEKDDKFRLITSGCRFVRTINVARITKCSIYTGEIKTCDSPPKAEYEQITLKVSNERNTLERCMLHFAHFEKKPKETEIIIFCTLNLIKTKNQKWLSVFFHSDRQLKLQNRAALKI